MGIFSKHVPAILHISEPLVCAFALIVQSPGRWFTVAELMGQTGASKSTLYRRFGDLVKHKALKQQTRDDFRQFKLHPDWRETAIGAELLRRAVAKGLLARPDRIA